MESLKEDEEFIRLIREIIAIDKELEVETHSPLHLVSPVNKKELLEKRREELNNQYMTCLIELDRIRIRETPYDKAIVDFLRKYAGYGPFNMDDLWKDYCQEILDYHEDGEVINRGYVLRRYFELIPPYVKVGITIPEGIKALYHESRWCFVYGQYNATVAMCRTVVETVLKTKFNLYGDLKDVLNTAKKRDIISGKTHWNANRVRMFANKILHEAKPISEKEAKDAIGRILIFLEEIYL